ncbi:MAG: chromate efflux transporter [Hyphomicrobiales bacterium]|nr:MAG: chromate efflux transporter [Hyphomicrobiales bacterium]
MTDTTAATAPEMAPGMTKGATPPFAEAFRTWARIGLLSFGGPAAQIALMHRIIVDEKKWLDEPHYLNALSFCMLLPGPEAMQLATYAGWRLHGLAGGLAAGLLFVLPGAAVVLTLSMIYASFGNVPWVEAVFYGIKAAVLIIVVEALLRISKRALKKPVHWAIAAASFVGIFFLELPFPLIIALAAALGAFLSNEAATSTDAKGMLPGAHGRTFVTIAVWTAIWFVPLLALAAVLGPKHILPQIGWFFSKLALVTFGGAYAVLAYMAQDVVSHHGWLSAGEMMDGLGLAETTPGPLILVTEFVAYVAAFKQGGIAAGIAGACVALWATFVPCFLWIFAGAPYVEWIISKPRLRGALAAITAAVVGVILNLTIWFGLHVFFGKVTPHGYGWLKLWVPDVATLDWRVVVLAGVSGVLLLQRHWGIAPVLAVVSALGLAFRLGGI